MGKASDDRTARSEEDPASLAQQREVRRLRRMRKRAHERGWEFVRRPDGAYALIDRSSGVVIVEGHDLAPFKRALQ
jgi:hypothetical protein